MIRGFFSPTHPNQPPYEPKHPPVPLINAAIWVPALGAITDPEASITALLLVDSGADMTVINPQDSLRLFRERSQWDVLRKLPSIQPGGAGQRQRHYREEAYVLLAHADGTVDSHHIPLSVAEPHDGNRSVESLLGRDITGNYVVTFDRLIDLRMELPE